MKKLYAILLCLLGSTFLLHAEILEKQIQVASFNRIDASSIYHIEVQQGSSRAVDLVYSEKLQSYLEVYVSNGTLYLRLDLPQTYRVDLSTKLHTLKIGMIDGIRQKNKKDKKN